MELRMSDLTINLDFGLTIDVIEYEAGYPQDRYSRVKILIKQIDRSRAEISELRISMPAEYAKSMAHKIIEETVQPPQEVAETPS